MKTLNYVPYVVRPVTEPQYEPVGLKLGDTFRFVGPSGRDVGDAINMVVKVVGEHEGLVFSNSRVKFGWTPITGPDAGRIYKFDNRPERPEHIELVSVNIEEYSE